MSSKQKGLHRNGLHLLISVQKGLFLGTRTPGTIKKDSRAGAKIHEYGGFKPIRGLTAGASVTTSFPK